MVTEITVIWLSTGACTGCSVSLLNTANPAINNLLVDQVVPGVHINLKFHATIMAGAGEPAIAVMEDTARQQKNGYLLIVEGAVPTAREVYGSIGERNGIPIRMDERVIELAKDAQAIIGVGTCASFGGIPACPPNLPGFKPVKEILEANGITKPQINIPGCPPHPDWFVGTLAGIILNGLPQAEDLDENLRPLTFYGKLIHENCPRRAYFDEGKFAKKFGEEGCLYEMGCKGPITYADCPLRRWNSGTNWVIGAGAPCNGCTQPEFPNQTMPFYQKLTDVQIPIVGEYWTKHEEMK